ncbi:MAG: hypothetical protein PHW43_11905 [Syntrophales bacterium]|nr:hypothetical protein [Syntrophales bacterium]
MKILRTVILFSAVLLLASSQAMAGDFDWMRDFNAQASLDPSGFRARIATRFHVGDAQISAVMSNIKEPAGIYMAFRLGEMSRRPVSRVVEVYEQNKGKGWGVLAKRLGIKPGSAEFHALKRGHDLDGYEQGNGKGKDKHKGKGKRKNKG